MRSIDGTREAALPFGDVIGDVGHEICVAALGLAHHAVFVVTVVGRLEPQRAVLLVSLAGIDQFLHCLRHAAAGRQEHFPALLVFVRFDWLDLYLVTASYCLFHAWGRDELHKKLTGRTRTSAWLQTACRLRAAGHPPVAGARGWQ